MAFPINTASIELPFVGTNMEHLIFFKPIFLLNEIEFIEEKPLIYLLAFLARLRHKFSS